jgi:hypothetical protein
MKKEKSEIYMQPRIMNLHMHFVLGQDRLSVML